MTCIAYKHPFIVADQRVTGGNASLFGSTKKVSVLDLSIQHNLFPEEHGKIYVGFAGDAATERVLVALIKAHLVGSESDQDAAQDKARKYLGEKKESGFECICVHVKNGVVQLYSLEPNLLMMEYDAPFSAIGAGGEVAIGALAAGADVWQAVHHTTIWNASCGYPIDGYNVLTGQYYKFNDVENIKDFLATQNFKIEYKNPYVLREHCA